MRMRGGSIVDLTWATRPAARAITGWEVVADRETLSDHRYITFSATVIPGEVLDRRHRRKASAKRWALKKLDEDLFMAAINAAMIGEGDGNRNLTDQRAWLQAVIEQACNVPEVKSRPTKKAYWWSEDIADLRRASDRAR